MVFQDLGLWPGSQSPRTSAIRSRFRSCRGRSGGGGSPRCSRPCGSTAWRAAAPAGLTRTQKLRTALARALVTQPSFLVLDEPLGSLEPRVGEECWDDLRRIHRGRRDDAGLHRRPARSARAGRPAGGDGSGQDSPVAARRRSFTAGRSTCSSPGCSGPTNLLQGQVESQMTEAKGEVVVRTPLGRLIGQMIPGQTGPGARGDDLGAARDRFTRPEHAGGLEPIPRNDRAHHLPRRAPADPRPRAGRLAGRCLGLAEPVNGAARGQSLTLSVAPEHVVVLSGKFAVG